MRTNRMLLAGLLAGLAGCSTMNNTEKGAVAGGAIGTGVGLLAGAATGNPRTGAAVGGLLGTGIGAVAGNDQDRKDERDRQIQQATAAATVQAQQERMGVTDVIRMAKSGHEDQVIINRIRETGSTFGPMSVSDLDFLKDNGVSGQVIAEMQTRRPGSAIAPRVVVREPAPAVIYQEPPPVVVVGPRPYYHHRPRPVMFVGGHYHW